MVQKKVVLFILIACVFANANYLLHLQYFNGTVSQEAVYYVDSEIEDDVGGELKLYVNNFSTNVSFPLITMYDPEDIFIYGVNRTTADSEIIGIDDESDAYVIIPEVPAGSMVRISNSTDILMDEPLMMPSSVEGKSELNMSVISICINDSGCLEGEECKDGSCTPKMPFCGSLFVLLAVPLVLKYSS